MSKYQHRDEMFRMSLLVSELWRLCVMTVHLCFQARMSDESQLAPHPRLQGIKMKKQDTGTTAYLFQSPPITSHTAS